MNQQMISVIVPCYNQDSFIKECLDSVVSQTYTNWECIVVDDGSVDHSAQIVKDYCSKESRIKYVFQNNAGLSAARNTGVKKSSGEYILPLDGDDKISPTYLEKAINQFNKKPETKLVYGQAELFGAVNRFWKLPKYNYEKLLLSNSIFCSAIYRKSDYLKTDGYDESMKAGYEDWDFWIRLLDKNSIVIELPEIHFYYRQREASMISFIKDEEKHNQVLNYLTQKHKEKYIELFEVKTHIEAYRKLYVYMNEKVRFDNSITYKTIYKIEKNIRLFFKWIIKKAK